MYEAVMIASAGLTNQQRRIDSIANNVANVNTLGYKSSRLDFKDALYTAGIVPASPRTPEGNQQKGHGVMVAAVAKDFASGGMYTTGNELDVAIENEGFFEVSDSEGNIFYTRNGSFSLSTAEDGTYLVNASGYFVHDTNGEKIRVPENTSAISIDDHGLITFSGEGEPTESRFGLFTFRNITGLVSVGGSNYAESESSGEKIPTDEAIIRQGSIEGSNVNLGDEMTRLIRAQRAFSLASRALRTADDMEGIANNLRK